MTWCKYTKSQMSYLNITVFWCCVIFLNLIQQILHVDFVEPINWLGLYLSYNWFMQSLKLVLAIFLYKRIFRRKVDLIYFFNCFLAAPQPTLGYYWGDNSHQSDFDPTFTGGLATRSFQGRLWALGQNCGKCNDYHPVSEALPLEMTQNWPGLAK